MQNIAWPGNISVYGGRNPPFSPACALLAVLILLPVQAGVLSFRHGLSFIPKWAYKHPGFQVLHSQTARKSQNSCWQHGPESHYFKIAAFFSCYC